MEKNEKEVRFLLSDLQCQQRDNQESRTIVGYAAVFEKWSKPIYGWFVEKIARGAFDACDFDSCILCFNHNSKDIVARQSAGNLKLSIDETGLRFEAEVPNTTVGNDLLENIRVGNIKECSFTFYVEEDQWRYADDQNGLEYDERVLVKIKKVTDVAPVVNPAYGDTSVDVRFLEERKEAHMKKHQDPGKIASECRKRLCQQLSLVNKI